MDIYPSKKRSEIMSKILSEETKPELIVGKYLSSNGFRFRKNLKSLPGKPDIVMEKLRTVVFVNGCFWHGHHCKAGKLPESNKDFWKSKIESNIERDKHKKKELNRSDWKVITIWQCEINTISKRDKKLPKLLKELMKIRSTINQ